MSTPVHSPDPGVPQTADKAKVGGIVAAAVIAVVLFAALYFDGKNGTTWAKTIMTAVVAVAGGGATALSVYTKKNQRKGHRA